MLLFGLFSESKDEWLVANTSTHAGISMILSSLAFIPLASLVADYYGVMALQLIASSIMLLVYLEAFLFIFGRCRRGSGKGNWDMGSLSTHLSRLENAGYIERRKAIVRGRVRTVVKITERGYSTYVNEVKKKSGG